MTSCIESKKIQFIEFDSGYYGFKETSYGRIRDIVRSKVEEKKLGLVIFATYDHNKALKFYHNMKMGQSHLDYRGQPSQFFYNISKEYELIGAICEGRYDLEMIAKIVNSILIKPREMLDALFLMAHGSEDRIGFMDFKGTGEIFMKGDSFKTIDLFSKIRENGIILTQACNTGSDHGMGFAKILSNYTKGRLVIAPQDMAFNCMYDSSGLFPFFFFASRYSRWLPFSFFMRFDTTGIQVSYFKDGECTVRLRSKL
jgi:hypothetical protein